ncbi:hypothetical protein LINPERPRIM_LOCUS7898 [Linum perenne]
MGRSKLVLLTPPTSSSLRHCRWVTCSCSPRDLFTSSTMLVRVLERCRFPQLSLQPTLMTPYWLSLSKLMSLLSKLSRLALL